MATAAGGVVSAHGHFYGSLNSFDTRLSAPVDLQAHENTRRNASISSISSHVSPGERCMMDLSLNKAHPRRRWLRCYAPQSAAGLKSFSFTQNKRNWYHGLGAAKIANSTLRVHPSSGEVYTTSLYPTVAATSLQEAGALGGAEVRAGWGLGSSLPANGFLPCPPAAHDLRNWLL